MFITCAERYSPIGYFKSRLKYISNVTLLDKVRKEVNIDGYYCILSILGSSCNALLLGRVGSREINLCLVEPLFYS
jgi:hypothetical protein